MILGTLLQTYLMYSVKDREHISVRSTLGQCFKSTSPLTSKRRVRITLINQM
jgi:hypothetical protein